MNGSGVPAELIAAVERRIDAEEVAELALALANIDSPTGREGEAGEYIHRWLEREGFEPRRVALLPERPNVVARVAGAGGGPSLLFNSHMDTTIAAEETLTTANAAAAVHHSGWREGDHLIGNGIVNDKGPMATWMIALAVLRRAGVTLRGDVLMTMVVGEIGVEPVDEFQAPEYIAKEAGARFVTNRGYSADYGIVAEGTDFTITGVEAGKAFFKVTVEGADPPRYTPYVPRPTSIPESPNAIVRATDVIRAIEQWAERYERDHTYVCRLGTVVPKVSVGAVRGGVPYKITKAPAVCQLYVDVRITPEQSLPSVQAELATVLAATGIPHRVEPFVFRRAFEAEGTEELEAAVTRAHRRVFDGEPGEPIPAITSMWRDSNVFIEAGIPTICYGPGASTGGGGKYAMRIETMVDAARVYAGVAMELCGVAD